MAVKHGVVTVPPDIFPRMLEYRQLLGMPLAEQMRRGMERWLDEQARVLDVARPPDPPKVA